MVVASGQVIAPEHDGQHRTLRAVRRFSGLQPWDGIHARLAAHPVFVGAAPSLIRRAVRWGVEADVDGGVTLLAQDRLGYWFLVILEGAVVLRRDGVDIEERGTGSHVGETAILGLGPQPAAVTTVTPTRLLILGRRELRSLCDSPDVRRNLFPTVAPDGFDAFVRALRAQADVDWRAVRPRLLPDKRPPGALPPSIRVVGGSRRDLLRASVRSFLGSIADAPPTPLRVVQPLSARARLALVAVATTIALAFSLLYHPPCFVVRPASAIDVVGDIRVDGAPVSAANGRYLLVPVDVRQPNLLGALFSTARRERVVWWARIGTRSERDAGRDVFRASQQRAVAIVERRLGLDPGRVHVAIRDLDIAGPSAGLVYALALCDVLDSVDIAAGRTIAATGELDDEGSVRPIGFASVKARSARRAGAAILLVPKGERGARPHEPTIVEVASLGDALRWLAPQGHGCGV